MARLCIYLIKLYRFECSQEVTPDCILGGNS